MESVYKLKEEIGEDKWNELVDEVNKEMNGKTPQELSLENIKNTDDEISKSDSESFIWDKTNQLFNDYKILKTLYKTTPISEYEEAEKIIDSLKNTSVFSENFDKLLGGIN